MSNRNTTSLRLGSLVLATVLLGGCELPPIESEQTGFRGTGMAQVETWQNATPPDEIPEPLPATPEGSGGPRAGDIYQNVQVLGDLSVGEFTRTMLAMTAWVAPEQNCEYCHAANLADDSKYTKVVSRRMLQMTQALNSEWQVHTGGAGVTCYTCHRGLNVPAEIWFADTQGDAMAHAGWRAEKQNRANPTVGYTALPADPLTYYLTGDNLERISVASDPWQPVWDQGSIQKTEYTYGLMFHLSDSLGVNCTYCHNSRSFYAWDESRPQRLTAWHGLRMVNQLNNEYLDPLLPVYPEYRLGPGGDAPKANCATCHQGKNKPLGGANMVKDYPALLPSGDGMSAHSALPMGHPAPQDRPEGG